MKGVISAPSGQYGVVTYNSTTNIAQLVNFSSEAHLPNYIHHNYYFKLIELQIHFIASNKEGGQSASFFVCI